MKSSIFLTFCLVLPLAMMPAVAQITITEEQWENTDFVRYSFIDSSTPPEWHRSYSIGITKDSIVVNVTSYGDVLLREVYPFTPERFDSVKNRLAEQKFSLCPPADVPLPPGGMSESVAFFKANESQAYFAGSVYAGIGTLRWEKGSISDAFVRVLPRSIHEIIAGTRKE